MVACKTNKIIATSHWAKILQGLPSTSFTAQCTKNRCAVSMTDVNVQWVDGKKCFFQHTCFGITPVAKKHVNYAKWVYFDYYLSFDWFSTANWHEILGSDQTAHYYVLQPLTTHLANFLHNQGYASTNHLHPPLFHIPGPLKLGS